MLKNKIIISKKEKMKGEDGYKTFSIRMKEQTLAILDEIVKETGRSRNEIINLMVEYGVKNYEIDD